MAGVEKIVDQILENAKTESEAILAEAKAQADIIIEEAKKSAAADAGSIEAKAQTEKDSLKSRTISAIDLRKSQAMLKAKQEEIAAVLDKAYQRLDTLGDDEYFEMILKLIGNNAGSEAGEIMFSERDLARMPQDFEKKINEAAGANAGKLSICRKAAKIENGFILVYGDIEENCSLRAIFDAKHDELTDLVHRVIS